MNKIIKTLKILIILLVVMCSIVIMPYVIYCGVIIMSPIAKPEIKYGEFPFTLTYELNGEIREIEDIIVCKFNGVGISDSGEKYLKWKTTLKSGSNKITLLDLRSLNITDEFDNTILELFFSYGNGGYYMGDRQKVSVAKISDYIEYEYKSKEGVIGGSAYTAEEAFNKYKIRLLSWKCAPPIENTFLPTLWERLFLRARQ